ncbi:ParB N-terminal domain-containing protein [Actinomadura madurae]|uniref:ParB N-terminal domain-containing protein n=1 Tax=Actinomadura madurae TaxID=1993 RepID=UPI0020260DEF|nr:methyltransferase domain-containing protein [Actinomadura madurae]MCP9950294.1 ParB N-terminal domain-containing protein [Actinomadura madurae]MCP9979541.1 ParB N-terminal domain-containing protein [Actinomadura madurae]URM95852.1 ParB N-terminal domain-containing protein [Actinomadura madurae]
MPTGIDMPGMQRVRRKSRAVLRKSGLAPSGPVYGRLVDAGRSLPIPAAARVAVSTAVLRRPWKVPVRFDQLLVGAQGGWTAREFAERTGDLLWPSTPFLDGPHVALLRLADERPDLTDEEILASGYGRLGLRCIEAGGDYFGGTDEAGVLAAARAFIARYRGEEVPGAQPRPQQSGPQDPVLVAPVRGSDQYQILDGHHRLAIAAMSGADGGNVVAKWLPVTTPLQDLLLKMSWLDGTHELYQPVDAPELRSGWTTVRQCTDRLAKMDAFLAERGIAGGRYLDVASCYGWFVAEMAERGFDAEGIERDPLAVPLGQAVYGLPDGVVSTGDCVEFLDGHDAGRWDVVSCFSLLHHFVLGRGSVSAEELIRLLDRATGRVLFFDTGQDNEAWFAESLRGWDPARVERFLREHTGFDEIVDLGPDDDARPPYEDNYGRHLFACVRAA